MTRTVLLHLLDGDGRPLGVLPGYDVPAPWWQEVADVVAGARAHYGPGPGGPNGLSRRR
ncbi:hypothetical protein [Plantactinospora mayteni]|uniref:hypothetical protein n=1 Tax=Plantactinospora mayteni TaxID=566021 RepID=UPI001944EE3B|nr:hypothetical protein [Plantactinospora mayteni]